MAELVVPTLWECLLCHIPRRLTLHNFVQRTALFLVDICSVKPVFK
jgi:hypothetical protein